jgi:hypothetical protein
MVTVELPDVAPTTVPLKITDAGEAPTPVLPVPVSDTVTGLGEASSEIVKVPLRVPPAVGANCTAIVQDAPLGSVAGHVFV